MFRTLLLVPFLFGSAALAEEPRVVDVTAKDSGGGLWRFDVTVAHADEGWEHYADAWEIATPDGLVLGTRRLAHPHVSEQPFTRSLRGVVVPEQVTLVRVRAHDSVHGWGAPVEITLPREVLET
ncbi:MAG: hypothetical protein KDK03_10525 [Rhodobacteraceae bacterium]|nr:hypothetical protein [Paracoccaceae bacterium]